jgi:flavodoxin
MEELMSSKVLVAYGTKYGATVGIAEKIGEVLRGAGLEAEVAAVDRAGDVAQYVAVVVGSAVYIGSWRKEAANFLKANEQKLTGMPVWLFSSGPTGDADEGLALPGRAAASRRSHQAAGCRPLGRRAGREETQRHREVHDQKREVAHGRLSRLGRHHGLGNRHRRSGAGN